MIALSNIQKHFFNLREKHFCIYFLRLAFPPYQHKYTKVKKYKINAL